MTDWPKVRRYGEPFFYRGGAVGCLVVHGFTASPEEVSGLGRHLGGLGYTVFGPRLPMHATQVEDMTRARWWDWYLAAEDGYRVLAAQCEQVVVIGLSMGGLAVLLLASEHPVAGVVAMGTPLALDDDIRLRFVRQLAVIKPFLPSRSREVREGPAWATRVAYEKTPVHGVAELLAFQRAVQGRLGQVRCPALVLHARHDLSAPQRNLDLVYDGLGSLDKEKVMFERGGHIVTVDVEHEAVFARVAGFVARVAVGGEM